MGHGPYSLFKMFGSERETQQTNAEDIAKNFFMVLDVEGIMQLWKLASNYTPSIKYYVFLDDYNVIKNNDFVSLIMYFLKEQILKGLKIARKIQNEINSQQKIEQTLEIKPEPLARILVDYVMKTLLHLNLDLIDTVDYSSELKKYPMESLSNFTNEWTRVHLIKDGQHHSVNIPLSTTNLREQLFLKEHLAKSIFEILQHTDIPNLIAKAILPSEHKIPLVHKTSLFKETVLPLHQCDDLLSDQPPPYSPRPH